jgi:probable HAF family extracellular repeat protein
MQRWAITAALAATIAAPLAAHAQTTIHLHPITIAGNDDVDATAINKAGTIVASVFDTTKNTQSGIVLRKGVATVLAKPYRGSAAPIPRAINDKGDILGYAYEGVPPHMFLLQSGTYNPKADITLVIEQQAGPPPLPIGLNHEDAVFYTIIVGLQDPTDPIYGRLAELHSMPRLMRYQTAHSINNAGLLAGTTFYGSGSSVFVGRAKAFTTLLPPGAKSANGGFVNNAGTVAGTYTDSANTQHGFTYQNGVYASFDMPETAQAYSVAVTGINDSGRVVGTYASQATGKQHAFLYNGAAVTPFGRFGRADDITVSINAHGEILLSRQIKQSATQYKSYRVTCDGAGC